MGTNTDIPTSVVCLMGAAMLFRGLDEESLQAGTRDSRPRDLLIAMLLFSVAITFKISSLVFASVGWTIAFVKLWMLTRNGAVRRRQVT